MKPNAPTASADLFSATKTAVMASPVKSGVSTPIGAPKKSAAWTTRGTQPMPREVEPRGEPKPALKPNPLTRVSDAESILLARADEELRKKRNRGMEAAKSIVRSGKLSLLSQGPAQSLPSEPAMTKTTVLHIKPEYMSVEALFEKAIGALDSGDLLTAQSFLAVVHTKSLRPTDTERAWELWNELGSHYYNKGHYKESRNAYEHGCELIPDQLVSQFNVGTARLMTGDFSGALEAFNRADSIEKYQPKVLCNVGAAYFLQDKYSMAERVLRETVRIQPDYVRALNTLSSALGALNCLEESFDICSRVLALRPGHPEASFKKGMICLQRQQLEEAVDCLYMARASSDLCFDSQCFLAQAYAVSAQPSEAEELLIFDDSILNRNQELLAGTWRTIGSSWRENQDLDRAVLAFRNACEQFPTDSEAWLELGHIYKDVGQAEYAEQCYRTCSDILRADPSQSAA